MRRAIILAGWLTFATVGSAFGQGAASTVQLPTFQMFTIDTTVWVPAGGKTVLGGMGRSAGAGSAIGTPFGPTNRALAGRTGASQVSISAQVHDMQALDAAVLAAADARRPGGLKVASGSTPVSLGHAPSGSVADARQALEAERAADQREAQEYLDKGQRCEADGKLGAARIYYQMASRRAQGDLKTQALAKLDALPCGAVKVAQAAKP